MSRGLSRVGIDTAGGIIQQGSNTFVSIEGALVVVVGSPVASHGDSPHRNATMIQGSDFVFIEGIPVCIQGSLASCGHMATGSDFVFAES